MPAEAIASIKKVVGLGPSNPVITRTFPFLGSVLLPLPAFEKYTSLKESRAAGLIKLPSLSGIEETSSP